MSNLIYLLKTRTKNQIKKAIRKPVTYIVIAAILAYCVGGYFSIVEWSKSTNEETLKATIFLVMLSIVILTFTSSLWSISRKRMVPFKRADVHFVFNAPINPKAMILYADKSIISYVVLSLIIFLIGTLVIGINFLTMLLCLLASLLLDEVCEIAIMVIVYGSSEDKRFSLYIRWFVQALMGFLVAFLAYMFFIENIGFDFFAIVSNPILHCIPLVGWAIGVYYSILIEPTLVTTICSGLYIITTISLLIYAIKLKSDGEYFEEASAFADEYEEIMKRSRRGEIKFSMKPKKLRKASIEYKGNGAKAILYRQILEYKKNRFFIFGIKSLINLVIGVAISFLIITNINSISGDEFFDYSRYILIGGMCYLAFISTGYRTKWSKEINVMYTFLIPDTPFNKLWYSTIIEHVRASIDAFLIVIPSSIGLRLNIIDIIGCLGIYIVIETAKLYIQIICQTIIQPSVGKVLGAFATIILQSLLYLIGAIMFLIGNTFIPNYGGMFLAIIIGLLLTWLLCYIAATQFERMENID